MPLFVVLGVGLESSLLESQSRVWRPAGYILRPACSVPEAIELFRDGDFDVVLLGHSLTAESRERLAFLIRATGSRIPVISTMDSSGNLDGFADATLAGEPNELLERIGELLVIKARISTPTTAIFGNAD